MAAGVTDFLKARRAARTDMVMVVDRKEDKMKSSRCAQSRTLSQPRQVTSCVPQWVMSYPTHVHAIELPRSMENT